MILIAILFPWLSFLLRGKIFQGLLCLLLQITVLGWIPAAIWAVASRVNGKNRKDLKEMEKRIKAIHSQNNGQLKP